VFLSTIQLIIAKWTVMIGLQKIIMGENLLLSNPNLNFGYILGVVDVIGEHWLREYLTMQ
jgi:hypothetical protein